MRDVVRSFFSAFGSASNLVQWSGTVLATLVMGHEMNISVKLF